MTLLEFATALQSTGLSTRLQSVSWVVPALQSLHILMVGVVFVSMLMIALRVLGWARAEQPIARVWGRFAPFLWIGLVVMALTGSLLTIAEPIREFMTLSFRIKLVLLAVAITTAALFGRSVRHALPNQPAPALLPLRTRLGAGAAILIWLAIIFLGRAIAYDDSIWGSWSPAVLQRGAGT
ncbi:MAG: hypothetical protein ABW278_02750 [Steroidobacteraceae bacterium]